MTVAVLATAGFVFNETFVYWFPNFLFAFLLLGGLLTINLIGRHLAEFMQIVFVSVAVSGFLLLSGIGLAGIVSEPASGAVANINGRTVLLGLLPFIGFELADQTRFDIRSGPKKTVFAPVAAITLIGLVYLFWGWVSALHVPVEKLIETTVPQTVAAGRIFGVTGRQIMGAITISSACAAVNAMFIGIPQRLQAAAKQGVIPPAWGKSWRYGSVPLVILAAVPAVMLAMGTAGSDHIDDYVTAGLLLWILTYAVLQLSMIILKIRMGTKGSGGEKSGLSLNILLFAIMGFSPFLIGISTVLDPIVFKVMGLSLFSFWLIGVLGKRTKVEIGSQ
jgi:amino acid transporter